MTGWCPPVRRRLLIFCKTSKVLQDEHGDQAAVLRRIVHLEASMRPMEELAERVAMLEARLATLGLVDLEFRVSKLEADEIRQPAHLAHPDNMAAESSRSSWRGDVHELKYGVHGEAPSTATLPGCSISLPHKSGTGSLQRSNETNRTPTRHTCQDSAIKVTAVHANVQHAGGTQKSEETLAHGRMPMEHRPEVYRPQSGRTRSSSSSRPRIHLPELPLGRLPLESAAVLPSTGATSRPSSSVSSRSSSKISVPSQPAPSASPALLTESSNCSAQRIRDQNLTRASLRHLQAAAQACTSGRPKQHGSAASMASFVAPPVWEPFAPISGDANKEAVPVEVTPWTKEMDLANIRQLSSGGLESSRRAVQRNDTASTWELGAC
mmetsp:Transcript_62877/g.124260  ORF Transcript_62877/g.124260 Transcript_62877/m.124260 type:complete len:380 (+) Transcript_62877:24-1163(+)